MTPWLIKEAALVAEKGVVYRDVLIRHGVFERVDPSIVPTYRVYEVGARGRFLFPGIIDLHVHFRTPGLTHKGDFASEGAAAVAGGVTRAYDMPNTLPPTTTRERLLDKHRMARQQAPLPIHFYIALTNTNADECLRAVDEGIAAGIKVFLGSTTGNLLLTNFEALEKVMAHTTAPVLVHAEEESLIRRQATEIRRRYGDRPPFSVHPLVRPAEACLAATRRIVELGRRHGTPLHILHLSTADEVEYLRTVKPHYPQLTVETCPQYLWFSADDFDRLRWRIKCNPAIKAPHHRQALWEAVTDGTIDTIGSDHAPHTPQEKERSYWESPSGMPMVQHTFSVLFTLAAEGRIPWHRLPVLLSEAPARRMGLARRGAIQEGWHADCFLADDRPAPPHVKYRCGWTPFEGVSLRGRVLQTWIGGRLTYQLTETAAANPSP